MGVSSYSCTVEADGTVDMGICAQTNAHSDEIGDFLMLRCDAPTPTLQDLGKTSFSVSEYGNHSHKRICS